MFTVLLFKMADPGFPSQHTTTTTVTNTEIISNLRYDNTYLYTIPGKLKIAQIVSFKLKTDIINYYILKHCYFSQFSFISFTCIFNIAL